MENKEEPKKEDFTPVWLKKENLLLPLIVIGGIFVFLLILFIILVCAVPGSPLVMEEHTIFSGQQAIFSLGFNDTDIEFKTDDEGMKIQMFSSEVVNKADFETRKQEFSFTKKLEGYGYAYVRLYNVYSSSEEVSAINYTVNAEHDKKAYCFLMRSNDFQLFLSEMNGVPHYNQKVELTATKEPKHKTLQVGDGDDFYLLFLNPDADPVTVFADGEYNEKWLKLEDKKPIKEGTNKFKNYAIMDTEVTAVVSYFHKEENERISSGTFSLGKEDGYHPDLAEVVALTLPSVLVAFIYLVVVVVFLVKSIVGANVKRETGTACTKSSFNIPFIVLGSVAGAILLLCVILFAAVRPYHSLYSINGIYSVGSSYQRSGTVSRWQLADTKYDLYFDTKDSKVSAYFYTFTDFLKLKREEKTTSLSLDTSVEKGDYKVLFNASVIPKDTDTQARINGTIKASLAIDILQVVPPVGMDVKEFDNVTFKKENDINLCSFCIGDTDKCAQCKFETPDAMAEIQIQPGQISFEYQTSAYIIALNRNPSSVTVKGDIDYTTAFAKMDKDKALKVCEKKCSFSKAEDIKIVLDYTGDEKSGVPVELYRREFHPRHEVGFGFLIPGIVLVGIAGLVMFYFRTRVQSKERYETRLLA